jgi:hypothetical protein
MAYDQEVVGSNPSTVYWMDVSNLLAITLKKIENKGSQMGHTKKYSLKKSLTSIKKKKKKFKSRSFQNISTSQEISFRILIGLDG